MLAGALADILGGDPDPVVALRIGDHRLEQPAVSLLYLPAAAQLGLSVTQSPGQRLPNPLEVRHVQHARAADGGHAPLDAGTRERGREQLAQALLQDRDLAAKLMTGQPIGGGIGDVDGDGIGRPDRLLRRTDALDLKQLLRHEAPPSALDGPQQSKPKLGAIYLFRAVRGVGWVTRTRKWASRAGLSRRRRPPYSVE